MLRMTTSSKPSADGRPDEQLGLQYPCGEPPESGHGKEIVPGVRWLRMHLPWALAHINLYALADDGGWAMVDTRRARRWPDGLARSPPRMRWPASASRACFAPTCTPTMWAWPAG
jgi:hypothetical protein